MKKAFSTLTFAIIILCSVSAQERITSATGAFAKLVGCWQGTLDYSGTVIRKPFTTSAKLYVTKLKGSDKFQLVHLYTPNAKDNVADTITISKDSKRVNHDTITSKLKTAEGDIEIITEALGFDHDNNKAAVVRQTYTIGKSLYAYKKQVKLEGQTDWLDREEFTYKRQQCDK